MLIIQTYCDFSSSYSKQLIQCICQLGIMYEILTQNNWQNQSQRSNIAALRPLVPSAAQLATVALDLITNQCV